MESVVHTAISKLLTHHYDVYLSLAGDRLIVVIDSIPKVCFVTRAWRLKDGRTTVRVCNKSTDTTPIDPSLITMIIAVLPQTSDVWLIPTDDIYGMKVINLNKNAECMRLGSKFFNSAVAFNEHKDTIVEAAQTVAVNLKKAIAEELTDIKDIFDEN